MNTQTELEALLVRDLLGELTPTERSRLDHLLASDPAAANHASTWRAAWQGLMLEPVSPTLVSPAVVDRLRRELPGAGVPGWARSLAWAALLLGSLAGYFLGNTLGNGLPEPTHGPTGIASAHLPAPSTEKSPQPTPAPTTPAPTTAVSEGPTPDTPSPTPAVAPTREVLPTSEVLASLEPTASEEAWSLDEGLAEGWWQAAEQGELADTLADTGELQ